MHPLNKHTSDVLYSVLTDGFPLGRRRCNRADPHLRGRCLYCKLIRGGNREETTQHAHSECPGTVLLLYTIYRTMMHVSATNASACAKTQGSSPSTLVQANIMALVTGLRLSDKSRSAAVSPAKDEPFSVLIAETHVAIQDRICRNGACSELASMKLDTPSLYLQIRKAVDIHTRHSLHLAQDTEKNLRILYCTQAYNLKIRDQSLNGGRSGRKLDVQLRMENPYYPKLARP